MGVMICLSTGQRKRKCREARSAARANPTTLSSSIWKIGPRATLRSTHRRALPRFSGARKTMLRGATGMQRPKKEGLARWEPKGPFAASWRAILTAVFGKGTWITPLPETFAIKTRHPRTGKENRPGCVKTVARCSLSMMTLNFLSVQLRVGAIASCARCCITRSGRAGQRRIDRSACAEKGLTFGRTVGADPSCGYASVLSGKGIARSRSGRQGC